MPAATAAPRNAAKEATVPPEPTLQSFSERVTPLDPLALFAHAQATMGGAAFWQRPDERLTLVGMGVAHQIALQGPAPAHWLFGEARREWRRLVAGATVAGTPGLLPLCMGGFAFDALRPATSLWNGFPAGLLTLPRLLFRQIGDEAWLTCSVVLAPGAPAERAFRTLRDEWLAARAAARDLPAGDLSRQARRPGHTAITSSPPHPSSPRPLIPSSPFPALVLDAAAAARAGTLEKVVLARAVTLPAEGTADAVTALERLRERPAGGTIFAFGDRGRCFLGATPERLVRLSDGRVTTAALAGSRARGATAAEDAALADELLRSRKDRWEHAIVVRELAEGLEAAGVTLDAHPATSVLKLATVQHLHTPLTGAAADGCAILDLLARLHPTPAVGGYPRADALAWIREREGLDRGWYSGPVGWLDSRGDGDFAVAIRSALLRRDGATLFAGCGIVGDSDPNAEDAESALKLRPMLTALQQRRQ